MCFCLARGIVIGTRDYLNPYAKENYRDMLNAGFLDNKVLEIL